MRIGILTTHFTEEEDRLIEAGKERGHEVVALDLLKCSISICPDDPKVYYEGSRIGSDFDAIIPRIDCPHTEFGFMVLRQFQAMGIYTTDTAYSLELCRDKLRCLQYLMRKNVRFPTTGYAHVKEDFKRIINTVGGCPLVIKLNEGTEGNGVFLAEDEKAAKNFLGTFKQFDTRIMAQEFISESAGTDVRVVIIGDEIIGAYKRESQDDDFRANLALGAHATNEILSEEDIDTVRRATKAININIAGVDLMRSKNGPLIIEINSALDFTGEHNIENVCKVDVAGAMIEYAVKGKLAHDRGEGVWLKSQTSDAVTLSVPSKGANDHHHEEIRVAIEDVA